MSGGDVRVQFACDADDLPPAPEIRAWVERALAAVTVRDLRAREVTVRIVGEAEGRELNRRYRGRDRATNVLSFPAASADAFAGLGDDELLPLGDLVLCAPVVAREAAAQGKPPAQHWGHLLVHGMLHLLGYDHQDAAGADAMETLEVRILAAHGIENPYRERDSA